ncbi:MAG: YbaK/EbsC family protein [Thermovirgaceae bacterium]
MTKISQEERAIAKVREFLAQNGLDGIIRETDETIRTVEDAARAVGVPTGEILKSIILLADEKAVLALMSGPNRVDMRKVKFILDAKKISMARPDWVFSFSGYKVGGVPPVGYDTQPLTLLDESLFQFDTVWAAAGTDHAFFPIEPDELKRLADGIACDIRQDKSSG